MVVVQLMITVLTWIEEVTVVFCSAEYHPQHIGAGFVQICIQNLLLLHKQAL